jgi:membrane protein YqaA with SNARE-associated domain
MTRSVRWPLFALVALILVLFVGLSSVTTADLFRWGAALTGNPLALAGIVIGMAVMMTFGLPGSLGFWLIAPFQPPIISVPLVTLGCVAGALGAYRVGAGLGERWRPNRLARQVLQLLAQRSDFLFQCALRIMPGFPHAFINLSAGVLRLPVGGFVMAAVLGLGVKFTVYAQAVQGMVHASQADDALGWSTMVPLILLAGLLALGGVGRRLLQNRQIKDSDA